jgi:recombination protein RecR
MANADYPGPILKLITLLRGLPGLGPRSAERMALWLMEQGPSRSGPLAQALGALVHEVAACEECGFFIERAQACELCDGTRRDRSLICVVERAADVLRLERSGAYKGLYHVLGGKLSPLDNVTPEDLRIEALRVRVAQGATREVILAVGSDVEGEATAGYLADVLSGSGVAVSRLAQGLPAGGALDHVDELTLYQAMNGRRPLR